MRSAQKNNRSRGRGNRKSGGGGGNIVNRVFDSAGPEGKVRGTPQQIIDKYLSLARDAQTSGDRVMTENFLQHAEHYQRLLIQATAQAEQNRREQAESASEHGDEREGDRREARESDRRDERDDERRDEREGDRREARESDRRDEREDERRDERESDQRSRRGRRGAKADEAGGKNEGEAEIAGMTTIDSGNDAEDLLVVAEDAAPPRPRRNGDGRRRRTTRQATEGEQAASGASGEVPDPVQQES